MKTDSVVKFPFPKKENGDCQTFLSHISVTVRLDNAEQRCTGSAGAALTLATIRLHLLSLTFNLHMQENSNPTWDCDMWWRAMAPRWFGARPNVFRRAKTKPAYRSLANSSNEMTDWMEAEPSKHTHTMVSLLLLFFSWSTCVVMRHVFQNWWKCFTIN